MILNKKNIFLFFMLTIISFPIFSQNAEVTFTKGKAEVLRAEKWLPLHTGDYLQESDVVSTGFLSELKVKYKDSVISLGPLTRLTFDEIKSFGTAKNSSVFLNAGFIRTKINNPFGKKISYSIETPAVIASADSADFMITGSGNVYCYNGSVSVYPNFEYKNANIKNKKQKAIQSEELDDESESTENLEFAKAKTSKKINASPAETVIVNKNRNIYVLKNGRICSLMKNSVNQIYKPLFSVSTLADLQKFESATIKSWEQKDVFLHDFNKNAATDFTSENIP